MASPVGVVMKQVPARTGSTDGAGFQDRSVSRRRCAIRSLTFFGAPPTQAPADITGIPLLRRWVARGARYLSPLPGERVGSMPPATSRRVVVPGKREQGTRNIRPWWW